MLVADIQGTRIYRIPEASKRIDKNGAPKEPKKLGKVHFPVFTPDGRRVVGYMIKLPDVVGMIKQQDKFVPLDAIEIYEGARCVVDVKENFDAAAAKRLGIDLDRCLIWTGMDVQTKSGKTIGYCADAAFDSKTGKVDHFALTGSAASSALLGNIEMPASYLKGYRAGAMIVDDDVLELGFTGGAAAKAAEVSVNVSTQVKKGAKVIDDKGSVAIDKGSKALGKQLGKTRGMFKSFASEYKKAAGTSSKKKAKGK